MSFPTLFNINDTESETLADELFGEELQAHPADARVYGRYEAADAARIDTDYVTRLIDRIEPLPTAHEAFLIHPSYNTTDGTISFFVPNGEVTMASRGWTHENFVTHVQHSVQEARLNDLEEWRGDAAMQHAAMQETINGLINSVDKLERMIRGEK